jgi:parvulin-like peptidyl-prolyl isomerase
MDDRTSMGNTQTRFHEEQRLLTPSGDVASTSTENGLAALTWLSHAVRVTQRWIVGPALLLSGCSSERNLLTAAPPPAEARAQKPERSDQPARDSEVLPTTFESVTARIDAPTGSSLAVKIRAHVNGRPILDKEVRALAIDELKRIEHYPEPEKSQQQRAILSAALERLIDRELILHDAAIKMEKMRSQYKQKLREAADREFQRQLRAWKESLEAQEGHKLTDDDLIEKLRENDLSLDDFRRQVEREFLKLEYMRSRVFPIVSQIDRAEIVEYYETHANEFQRVDSVRWQDIFVDVLNYPSREAARKTALEIQTRAKKGEDWANLMKYDDGDSRIYRNGEGLGQRRGEIRPVEAEEILFKMRDGEVGPLIELTNGFHVIRLIQRERAGLRPLDDELQAQIKKKLQEEAAQREYRRIVLDLRRRASIEVNKE